MKQVLLITYHFPPDAAVGAIRPSKFVDYLPEFGWEPIILTVKPRYYGVFDPLVSTPNYGSTRHTLRTRMLQNPSFYYRKLKRGLHINRRIFTVGKSPASNESFPSSMNLREWLNFLFAFPDEQVGWLPFALMRGIREIHLRGIKVIMTLAPPPSTHLIGALLSILTRIPWIADFRDPWSDDPWDDGGLSPLGYPNEQCVRIARRLEAWFVSRAAFTTTTTRRFSDLLSLRFPQYRNKFISITNGFDEKEFAGISTEKYKTFTISYVGTVYHHRNPEPIIQSISELVKAEEISSNRIIMRFIGQDNNGKGNIIRSLADQYGINDIIDMTPWVPRREAIEIMLRSHVLLVLAENQPLQIPGKIFDYLGAGSNILAVTGDGATSDLLSEIEAAVVVQPGDHQALKSAIKAFYTKFLQGKQVDKDCASARTFSSFNYSRRQLTEKLTDLLEKAVDSDRRKK